MSGLQKSGLTLASVIGTCHPEVLTEWESFKQSNHLLPAQFHAMFWGKSMDQKCQDAEPPLPVEQRGLGREGPHGDGDRSEEGDLDDDVIKGCHFLEIDIEGFAYPKIWIRAEYMRIYDALETHYQTPSYPNLAPAAVITGQPGIGKSVWIYYALRRSLAERKLVIWYQDDTRYLFVEEGVYVVPESFKASHFRVFIWTLVDSDHAMEGVPSHLVNHGTHHFVIFCTSPRKERWSRMHKTVREVIIIMNPWKSNEMLRVGSALPPGMIDQESVQRVFHQLGPTPRLCIDYVCSLSRMEKYKQEVEKEIKALTIRELEQLVEDSSSLAMDAVSHKLCLIHRLVREDVYSRPIVAPITSSIHSRLADRFRTLELKEKTRL